MNLAQLQWFSNPPDVRARAEKAGEEMAVRLEAYAIHAGQPFTVWQSWVLRHDVMDFIEVSEQFSLTHTVRESDAYDTGLQQEVATTSMKGVLLVRRAMITDRDMGMATVTVRPDLRIPSWWEDRYQLVYQTGLTWMLSAILQSAFLGAPELGEKKPWRAP